MSSSLNRLSSNTMRITGLSSNMDTESIVKSLLQIDQMKVDKQYKLKTKLEWKGDAYRAVNMELRTFREKYMSVLSEDNVFSSKAFNDYKANMHTSTGAVTVKAGTNSLAGSYNISKISQLATAASARSQNIFKADYKYSADATLGELEFAQELTFGDDGKVSFSINDVEFSFSKDDKLSTVLSKINTSAAGVSVHFSELGEGLVMTSKTTGEDSKIEIVNKSGNLFGPNSALGIDATGANAIHGQNAKITIEGIEKEFANNSFTIDGISFTLHTTYNVDSNGDDLPVGEELSPIRFSVERDYDATIDRVQKFVDGYNELVESLNGRLTEKVNRNYDPLTDDEKSYLSEKEAEKWEELAKSGLLRNDGNLSALLSSIRSAFFSKVEGTGLSAAEIGLTTTSNYMDGGKIQLDKDVLRKALENNADQVAQVFTGVSESSDPATKYAESGLITRISEAMSSYVTTVTDVTLASNSSQIDRADDKLTQLQDWIEKNEDRYWAKFTAMETALSQLQSQSNWLTSLFSSSSQ